MSGENVRINQYSNTFELSVMVERDMLLVGCKMCTVKGAVRHCCVVTTQNLDICLANRKITSFLAKYIICLVNMILFIMHMVVS